MAPEKVLVPVAPTFTPCANAEPLTIGPVTLRFALPNKSTTTGTVVFAERVNPPISRVFPAPLAVSVLPDEALVIFTGPIVNFAPVPAKVIVLLELAATVPVPRSRLFAAVFVDDPKVSESVHVQA